MHWLFSKSSIDIYTDGSQKGKWGAWAYVIVKKNKILQQKSARILKATSNEMEFQAAIEAFKCLEKKSRVRFFSDSKILIDTLLEKDPGPKNQSLQIQLLKEACAKHEVDFNWIPAHSGVPYNELCDELCKSARQNGRREGLR